MKNTMIWVDDVKTAPNGCDVARTYQEAFMMLRDNEYDILYLDHDLGGDDTGYDLLCELVAFHIRLPKNIYCISMNPVGRKRIEDFVKEYQERK
jgi:hypothetical protein